MNIKKNSKGTIQNPFFLYEFDSIISNHELNPSSRYFCPRPFTKRSLRRIALSTNFVINSVVCGCSLCLRRFLSLQTAWTEAWNAYRRRNCFVGGKLAFETIVTISFHSEVNAPCKIPPTRDFHIWVEYLKLKNRWRQVSCSSLQRMQTGLTVVLHRVILSHVCRRWCRATQPRRRTLVWTAETKCLWSTHTLDARNAAASMFSW